MSTANKDGIVYAGSYRDRITPEYVQTVLAAFLKHGRKFKVVADELGISQPTAAKYWERGWPQLRIAPLKLEYYRITGTTEPEARASKGISFTSPEISFSPTNGAAPESSNNAPPYNAAQHNIPQQTTEAPKVIVLTQREIDARVTRAVNLVKAQVANTLESEYKILSAARSNILGMTILADKALRAANKVFDKMEEQLLLDLASGKLTAIEMVKLLGTIAKSMTTVAYSAGEVMKHQRLMVGMPQAITETRAPAPGAPPTGDPVEDMSAKLIATLSRAQSGLEQHGNVSHEYSGEEMAGQSSAPPPRAPDPVMALPPMVADATDDADE